MTYKVEDEVDWSDGTIDEPLPTPTGTSGDSGYVSPIAHEDDGLGYLFELPEEHQADVPPEFDLPPALEHQILTSAKRVRVGRRLNRRQPSEQDYAHFALYQANQKTYEATFLKHFVHHVLHPSQIEQCFQQGTDGFTNVQAYVASVVVNLNGIANKIIWNAHCRTVNLLAKAGKDAAPFWDVGSFDRAIFADFDPRDMIPVANKMNESWHHVATKPSMIRYTTKDYPIGHHISPLEEIDDVADSLFNQEAFGNSMPAGRTVEMPTKKRAKGRGLPGASVRDRTETTRRGNWLASLVSPTVVPGQCASPQSVPVEVSENTSTVAEPRSLDALHCYQDRTSTGPDQPVVPSLTQVHQSANTFSANPTRLEQLFEQFGAGALDPCHSANVATHRQRQIELNLTWPIKLLDDHKRRLMKRSPQSTRQTLPNLRAVIAQASQQGYRPACAGIISSDSLSDHYKGDLEQLFMDVEDRKQSEAAHTEVLGQKNCVSQTQQAVSSSTRALSHSKKRKREQPAPIRMFNRPLERSNKRSRVDLSSSSKLAPPKSSPSVDRLRKQNITTSAISGFTTRPSKPTERKMSDGTSPALQTPSPLPPHPSGSRALEPHQHLPPGAYFAPRSLNEKFVWRCSIKHALGHYYNAGDRKNCPGCFTALSDNTNAVTMDFYLPSRTYYHQPNPVSLWKPSKPFGTTFGRARRSKHLSHNSIAKEAYWAAIDDNANTDEARRLAVDTVLQHLAPKPPPREPTPAPTPTPEPDLGPHPSGSAAMEHGQDIPYCTYFQRRERHEDFAWRCDINHALGRYYLAGDKRSCPGCGSNKGGLGRHAIMDFYLPPGVCVRQEMLHCLWKPRKPYKAREGRDPARKKGAESTHNQIASRMYREAIGAGQTPEDALKWAVLETDRWVDEREDEACRRAKRATREHSGRSTQTPRRRRAAHDDHTLPTSSTALNAARARASAAARTRTSDAGTDVDVGDADTYDTEHEAYDAPLADGDGASSYSSSPSNNDSSDNDDDDTSSASDSE